MLVALGLHALGDEHHVDIGIPRETRSREHRVALTPAAVRSLAGEGHRVWVEAGAGMAAGHPDSDYEASGARIAYSRHEVFTRAGLLSCVFAPEPKEYAFLQARQIVIGFWGLPAMRREDIEALLEREVTAVGEEAIEDEDGRAIVLTSMSEIAGGLAVTVGSGLLLNTFGGKGILMGGVPGVPPADFVILGAGTLGRSAAQAALGAGANVTLLDRDVGALREASRRVAGPVTTLVSTRANIEKALSFADVVLGAVAVHGERAPVLVTREMLGLMKPRSVVLDLSIDMGGCFETSRPTVLPDSTYEVDGIIHFCVPNLPSYAARASTSALTNALLPYISTVAREGFEVAAKTHPDLARGTYLHGGRCVMESLARTFGFPWPPPMRD